jgi:hypothetical protein
VARAPAIGRDDPVVSVPANGQSVPPRSVAAAVEAMDNETVLSVLPARLPADGRPIAATPSEASPLTAAPRASEVPPPRAAMPELAAPPRMTEAAANRSAKADSAQAMDPRARCGERNYVSTLMCLTRECQNPTLSAHPECVSLRALEAGLRPGNDR